ncbi:transcriptional regulator, TetR family [Solimonas aquatica]|uniref:Transcriptional regulator, TetR family n=1 Tax=Solimonas aquatica TaxID=489703 RepID=A0A1H9BAM4_9GAMM|nr:TetR family transcriptional regulator [Solimonas aquatica]SEP85713.1 transcriptional regulator, TetR family [Solimonas aquatica]
MSKTTLSKSDRTRQRILDAAAAAFREHGVDQVGVRDIMKLAGLTRGGFYFHFDDKDALLAEATREAARSNAASHASWAEKAPKGKRLQTFIEQYLSEEHRDNPQRGCFLAAFGGEIGRSSAPQRKAFTEAVGMVVDGIAALLPGTSHAKRKTQAELLISSMAGVVSASRAISDRAQSAALLAAARKFYSETFKEA